MEKYSTSPYEIYFPALLRAGVDSEFPPLMRNGERSSLFPSIPQTPIEKPSLFDNDEQANQSSDVNSDKVEDLLHAT